MAYYIAPPPQGPLARIIAGIVAALLLAGTFMIGIVAFLVIAGIVAVAALVFWARLTWLRHRLGKTRHGPAETPRRNAPGDVIDAEYTVVDTSSDTSRDDNGN